jgi:hypothetical protein
VPAAKEPVTAETVTVPLPLPEVGDRVSQAALSLADHVNVPPPVLLMLRVWAAGLLPCWAVKDKFTGLALMTGDGLGAGGGVEEDDDGESS